MGEQCPLDMDEPFTKGPLPLEWIDEPLTCACIVYNRSIEPLSSLRNNLPIYRFQGATL